MREVLLVFVSIITFIVSAVKADESRLFSLIGSWNTVDGKTVKLSDFEGKKAVIALFYTSCQSICPMTTENLKKLEKQIGDRADKVNFILLSIDPSRDEPKALKKFAEQHGVNKSNWHLLASSEDQVQKASAAIGLGFGDQPGNPGLHRMHSLQFAVVGAHGKVLGTFKSLDPDLRLASEILK